MLQPTINFMTLSNPDLDQWLSLSESPSAPNLFFLGALDSRITFYSQQVRALRLMQAIHVRARVPSQGRVAVVGAGAAGVTAAFACGLLGYRAELIEAATGILPLQSATSRLLHPHIYEWPTLGSLQDNAVLPFLDWRGDEGKGIRGKLAKFFEDEKPTNVRLKTSTTLTAIEHVNSEWRLLLDSQGKQIDCRYDAVIVCMGFGAEKGCGEAPLIDYWRDPGPDSNVVEIDLKRYFLSGSGDGGLTDLMAVLVQQFEHVSFTKEFLRQYGTPELAAAIWDAEAATTAVGGNLEPMFHALLLPILTRRGVIEDLGEKLRDDRSLVFNANPVFAKHKASRLNQVMAYAVMEAAKLHPGLLRRSSGKIDGVLKTNDGYIVSGPTIAAASLAEGFHTVILRHGPDIESRYMALKEMFVDYKLHHDTLVKDHPEWLEPPQLLPDTFEFFDSLYVASIKDIHSKTARIDLATERRTRLLVTWDAAYQNPIQQGANNLLHLAKNVDRLGTPVTIVLAVTPAQISQYVEVLQRLVRASNGHLRVAAIQDTWHAWHQIFPAMSTVTPFNTPYRAEPLSNFESLRESLDEVLIRALSHGITTVVSTGQWPGLGTVHGTITASFTGTWNSWVNSLNSDPRLRADFLRLLYQVELAGKDSWSGDPSHLPGLVSALVLMLATHASEALTPAHCSPGNLQFGSKAICLGSGCHIIDGKPISDIEDADAWNVDALILSGAGEEMFQSADLLSDAGKTPTSLARARRVSPIVIPNTKKWRKLLSGDLAQWQKAVMGEFDDWKKRQDKTLESA